MLWEPPVWLAVALVSTRLVFVLASLARPAPNDATMGRFLEIARAPGTPYVDHVVEYTPIDVALLRLMAPSDQGALWIEMHALAFVCDIGVAASIFFAWGRPAATRYLLFGLPVVWLLFMRLDLVSVLLAVGGMALVHRNRERLGGAVIGLGALAKVWPLVLLVPLAAQGRRRAVTWAAAAASAAVGAWLLITGGSGPSQVLSFRGATGWSVDSTVGAALWQITDPPVRLEAGSWRVAEVTVAAKLGVLALLAIALLAIARRSRSSFDDPAGSASLAAVAALATLSPLDSLQYTAWLLPWAAIAGPREVRVLAPALIAILATSGAAYVLGTQGLTAPLGVLFLIRSLATAGCVIAYLSQPTRVGLRSESGRPVDSG